jgi:hypothetical protein
VSWNFADTRCESSNPSSTDGGSFLDALPGLVVFGPNYEDLLGRLKRGARNVLHARGEIVTDIEITTIQSGEVAMALWVIPGAKGGVMDAALNAAL